MTKLTQTTRHIAIDTPLGEDVLLLQRFSAHEEMSCLFTFDLDLLSKDYEIDFEDIIGQNVTVSMELPGGGKRYWNGFINRFEQVVSTRRKFAQYEATMVPWLWFLTLTSDCRIFQEKTVPDIVKKVFKDLGFSDIEDRLSPGYRTWNYCVQYRETHFNFVSRLMEQEGIYYYFLHEKGKCTIVLCDSLSKHDKYGDYGEIKYIPDTSHSSLQERISDWAIQKQVLPGKFAHTDYNFEKPSTSLMSTEKDQKSHARGKYEIYDFPGEYPEKADGDRYAKVRMEELAHAHEVCTGQSDSRGLCSGYKFKLSNHPRGDQNREYLILSTDYQAAAENYETSGGIDDMCACFFTVIPGAVQYRQERKTPKPVIQGTQTAVVTGPAGEEIHTNKYGQVKVQFHWDREGKNDENSSCWIRVRQTWAGKGWGGLYIPRIGQEVIVDFLEGDPDQPIVVGTVYHATNMPPYDLPAEKTKSTLKSDSTIGGGGSNEFRFEDKKGSEEVYLHGQKDWTIAIENDKNQTIGHDETMSVGNNRTKTVGVDQSESIGKNKSITVGTNHDEKVGANKTETIGANKSLTVGANQTDTVAVAKAMTIGAAYQVTVGAAMNETIGAAKAEEIGATKSVNVGANSSENVGGDKSVDAGKNISESAGKDVAITSGKKMSLTAGDDFSVSGKKKGVIDIEDQLTIKVGKASITMNKNGDITIKGKTINVKGSGNIVMKAKKILEN
ncbi:type VI secretion system tip protein TssI/VgrG [uncultured Desulfobacter sp.]|uniref:type VI secretion system tip protein TssI/VgrG n=1 Tax=uncultured Desulfobacter sp. TaxID=240139 RepID=UPI0029C7FE92|nr:type VI secretion system tip protein TssI/VgrG [uncultured Desulfobacter sp.]